MLLLYLATLLLPRCALFARVGRGAGGGVGGGGTCVIQQQAEKSCNTASAPAKQFCFKSAALLHSLIVDGAAALAPALRCRSVCPAGYRSAPHPWQQPRHSAPKHYLCCCLWVASRCIHATYGTGHALHLCCAAARLLGGSALEHQHTNPRLCSAPCSNPLHAHALAECVSSTPVLVAASNYAPPGRCRP